jgi:hypothetical protein
VLEQLHRLGEVALPRDIERCLAAIILELAAGARGDQCLRQNEIPRVAGQWPQYVRKQLVDFKARRRTNDAGNMTSVAVTLSDADIENLSHYIGNL